MLTQTFMAMGHAVKEIGVKQSVRNVYERDGRRRVGETIRIDPDDIVEADLTVDFSSITLFSRVAMQEEGLKLMEADQMHETQFQAEVMATRDLAAWRDQRTLDKLDKSMDEKALQDVLLLIDELRGAVAQEAVAEAAVEPVVSTDEDQLRADRGASMPIGPGQAMPLEPTPPMEAEMGVPI